MIDEIGGPTAQLVTLALDAAVLRHKVIANNIANANTPGFEPQRLEFEQLLLEVETQRTPQSKAMLTEHVERLKPLINSGETIVETADAKVELDTEMKNLAENTLYYQALLEGLSKRSSIIKMAITQQGGN